MNFGEMKAQVMFQTNNDADDLGDFEPALGDYLNEGYDMLLYAFAGVHLGDEYQNMTVDKEVPEVPAWTHRALTDYATYCVYRNGSKPKQQRGQEYLRRFLEVLSQLRGMTDGEKGMLNEDGSSKVQKYGKYFKNIPW